MLTKLFATTAMVALMTSGAMAADHEASKDMTQGGQPVFSQDAGQDMTSETGYFEASNKQILASNLLGATVYTERSGERGAAMNQDDQSSGYGTNGTTAAQDGRVDGQAANGQQAAGAMNDNQDAGMADGDRTAEALDGNEAATDQAARQTAMMDNYDNVGDVNDVVMGQDGQAEAVVIGVGGFLGIGEKNVAVDFDKLSWVDRDGERWLMISATREELEAAPSFDTASVENNGQRQDRMASDEQMDQTNRQDRVASDEQMDQTNRQDRMASDEQMDQTDRQDNMAATDDRNAVDRETTAAVNRDGWTATQQGEMSAENLLGTSVYGANDEDLGEIGDVILTADGQIEAYVVDVGGFLGLGEKPVALDARELQIMRNGNGEHRIFTRFTEEQLEQQPSYDEATYATNRDQMLLR
ncbi:MAG: PRC-barrel domain-containing protein [Zhengella sp.]|uniref:PRC-barrel domain-containing protein n=1 Tax=Zhengella sp. TaxID=2282762 RepID=UPI0035272D35|nr:PRC-barrel domain-containing protein [Brucellaceae bacterium]